MNNYTIYHLHSMHSNCVTNIDSITPFQTYVDFAAANGMKAMAFSEHGSVFSWLKKKEAIEKAGMKYIHAEEFYVTESLDEKLRDNYHCVLIAKNYEGFLELNKLSSASFNRKDGHFYYRPRISFEELINTSDNIIITTACLASILNRGTEELRERFINFLRRNSHRCFLEIQHHNIQDQINYNQYLLELNEDIDVPLIAGTDTHAIDEEHMNGRAIMQKAKNVRFAEEDGWDLTAKTYDQLVDAYEKQGIFPTDIILEAIENTNIMADMVEEFEITREYKYPHLWENPEGLIRQKIYEGIIRRGVDKYPNYQDYLDRIEEEMEAYIHNGAIDFMLLMEDIIAWMRDNDIMPGYGRGSVNGSVVAWLLGITEMDSIKHKLSFSRFMNVERVSLSDIDTDIPPSRIEDVKQYIMSKPGLNCSDIITFNTVSDKGAIRDVGRALEIPLKEVDEICNCVDNAKEYEKVRGKYKDLFYYVDLVKGVIVSMGTHPCGMIVSPQNLDDNIGLCTTSTSPYPVSQIYMKEIDSLNYVKLDLLKLDTIEIINNTCKLAGIERLTPDNVDINDDNVWNAMREDTAGIFQWNSGTGSDYIRKLLSDSTIAKFKKVMPDVDKMTLLSIGNSAIRPAGESYREDLANGVIRTTGSKPIDSFLGNTFGFLVFQEQIISFLHEYCGFTMGEADVVRRCVEENTLITMQNGVRKPIKDINPGEYVQCYDDDGRCRAARVNQKYDNGIQKTYKISIKNNHSIIATDSHKILTQRGWIKIKDLIPKSDYVMIPKKICDCGDGLTSNKRLNVSDMFLIGLLIGDGTIGDNALTFTNSDIELIDAFKSCVNNRLRIGEKDGCKFSINEVDGVTVEKIYSISPQTLSYKNSVKGLLKKLGINKKSADKHIPDQIMSYPANRKIQHLLGGLFSTDGGYAKANNSLDYSSISQRLVLDIQSLLHKFGIYSYIDSKFIKEYNYNSYRLMITQINSLIKFQKYIVPYMVGKKKDVFNEIIEKHKNTENTINYILPRNYIEEIKKASKEQKISILSTVGKVETRNESGITDTKAKKIVSELYYPQTYKMLHSDYVPMKIKSIEEVGERHVYDIEVDKYHNYIANNIIVHNCFAKKTGTQDTIPVIVHGGYLNGNKKHYIDGYIKTMSERYGIAEKKSEKDIVAFIKVIEDASNYLFSLNHSQPYSYEGYVCSYLRTYYPTEFLTVSLNVNAGKEEKTKELTAYAKKQNIRIESPHYGHSKSGYECDAPNRIIYKGIKSIKYMNDKIADELLDASRHKFRNFIDLLYYIDDNCTVDKRQLLILIKLDFFSEFGDINYLLKQFELFDEFADKKFVQKAKLEPFGISENLVRDLAEKETPTRFTVDIKEFLRTVTKNITVEPCTLSDKIRYQIELLGYTDYTDPDRDPRYAFVTAVDTKYSPVINAYCLNNGATRKFKIHKSKNPKDYKVMKTWRDLPLEVGDIIYISKNEKKPAKKKVDNDWVVVDGKYNYWINDYRKVEI